MGIYSRYLFPRLMNFTLSGGVFIKQRIQVLAGLRGEVLEIGFGTGLNLPHYPAGLQRLTAIDPNLGMAALARKRIAASPIQVKFEALDGERLPMPDATFDRVVSTWTLCSIPNVEQALDEIRRVLKPEGRFHFVEHGLSPDTGVAKWQHRLNPIQKAVGDGCHLNRDFRALIGGRGFRFVQLDTFYMEKSPRVAGYLYRGEAAKA